MKTVRAWILCSIVCCASFVGATESVYEIEQQAFRAAIANVADCVVQIRTVGGLERVGDTQLTPGPTTGLIISPDGYIVSSAFNFAQRPSSILVRLPSGTQVAAKLVARDHNRLLVLLKVETDEILPAPEYAPHEEMAVGQWTIALGRTFQEDQVDISLGIISALNRKHGRALQTDASISTANYGGPLVDIQGRVLGVLVPMSPGEGSDGPESEVAGAEFYDSGIGFAIPLVDVMQTFERWQQGEDLHPGKLGIGLMAGSPYITPPKITSVWPGSPAAQAGWKSQDEIIAIDGEPVSTQSQLRFKIRPRYAGESLTISIRRGDDEKAEEFDTEIELTEKLAPYRQAFLGILPATVAGEEPEMGVPVRIVWPDSPADKAGIEPEDLVTKIGETEVTSTVLAAGALRSLRPEESVEVVVKRDDEELVLSVELAALPEQILTDEQLYPEDLEQADDDSDLPELQPLKVLEFAQLAQYLAPKPQEGRRPGLLLWLVSDEDDEKLAAAWQTHIQREHLTLVLAKPASAIGWSFDDGEYLTTLLRFANLQLGIDRNRVVVGGSGKAGQLAYALALRRPQEFAGVVSGNAPLPRTITISGSSPSNQLAVLSLQAEESNFASLIRDDIGKLREAGYPVSVWRVGANASSEGALDDEAFSAIARWIAGLERL